MIGTAQATAQKRWIALLGKRNRPVDGVDDYCTFLGEALLAHGIELEKVRVSWDEVGWPAALARLDAQSSSWSGTTVLLQFTSLAWSARGFPFQALKVLDVLQKRGAQVIVVYHEPFGQTMGRFLIQSVRAACQNFVIRTLHRRAPKSVFTLPLKSVGWLPAGDAKSAFIPIGANIPQPPATSDEPGAAPAPKIVAVFCFSTDSSRFQEGNEIAAALRATAQRISGLQLLLLGRGTPEMAPDIEGQLSGTAIRISTKGDVPAAEATRLLSQATVQLFVRGPVTQVRGSVLAGIACGLPVVGYAGEAAGTPIEEAGLLLVSPRDTGALAASLIRIFQDESLLSELRHRSLDTQKRYFAWPAIAEAFVTFQASNLSHEPPPSSR